MSEPTQEMLEALASRVGTALAARGETLVTAESCTGGWVGQVLTSVAGSSSWYERGFISYANSAKQELLAVSTDNLRTHGAVSEQVAVAMAFGALKNSHCQWALAITGVAGPGGGTAEKPVGTVCFSWVKRDGIQRTETHHFAGDRRMVRALSVSAALNGLLTLLAEQGPALA